MRREKRLICPARGVTTALPIFEDVSLARNPRSTHYEDVAPAPWALYQHRQHHSRRSRHLATWLNTIRHARTHASDQNVKIDELD
jgi:hypothetical protein